ncbi:MAG: sarcosine oxidase subunit gamma family protein, partial [Pseudomonadota bacterium]
NEEGEAGVIACEREGLGLATIETRKGKSSALIDACQKTYGVALHDGPALTKGDKAGFIGTGPGQWLAVSEDLPNETLAEDLSRSLSGLASVSDQSSGRAVLRLEGPMVRDCLAKGLAIDLDTRVFVDGSAATSILSHMGVTVWRDGEVFDIVLFRSVAASFWHWLEASAAEYGLEVITTS